MSIFESFKVYEAMSLALNQKPFGAYSISSFETSCELEKVDEYHCPQMRHTEDGDLVVNKVGETDWPKQVIWSSNLAVEGANQPAMTLNAPSVLDAGSIVTMLISKKQPNGGFYWKEKCFLIPKGFVGIPRSGEYGELVGYVSITPITSPEALAAFGKRAKMTRKYPAAAEQLPLVFPHVPGISRMTVTPLCVLYTMQSGEVYKVVATEEEYIHELTFGGFFIFYYVKACDQWRFIDNSPDGKTLENFLNAINRKTPKGL